MTTLPRRVAGLPRVPLAVLLLSLIVAGVSQVLPRSASPLTQARPTIATADRVGSDGAGGFDPLAPAGAVVTTADLERIRADVTFWGDRFSKSPRDFISATRMAASEIELARATGDISAYLAGAVAVEGSLKAYPDYPLALDYRGVIQVALHQFTAARDNAIAILAATPNDPTALATLGDASLELGDLPAANTAYRKLTALGDSAAARVRVSHLAFIQGQTADAVSAARSAVRAAIDDETAGSA
ncbi:MAG: hypothetical protein ABI553_01505, partial [Chloroflexota bacterium]